MSLKYALIGCGIVAGKHLQAVRYNRKSLELRALVDNNDAAARYFIKQHGLSEKNIKIYTDPEEMLKQEKPDLTAITTPSGSHYSLAAAALRSGSHVLVEKPLTLRLDEADKLLELAGDKNLQLAVGHIYRFFPVVQMIEKQLREGRWGRILYGDVKVRWGHDQAYYDQAKWRGTWQMDGGALMNQSIHALDLMLWLLGGNIISASGWLEKFSHNIEAEDFGLARFRLDNGTCCSLEGTTCTDPNQKEASFFICCEKGEIRAGLLAGKPRIEVLDRSGSRQASGLFIKYLNGLVRTRGLAAIGQLKNPHSFLYADLIDSTRTGISPLADGKSGRQALEAVLAVYKSALDDKTVELPLGDFTLAEMNEFFPQNNRI